MTQGRSYISTTQLLIIFFSIASCTAQSNKSKSQNKDYKTSQTENPGTQIGNYVVEIFEDSNNNLWFGTMSKGVARYSPYSKAEGIDKLVYFTTKDGLTGNTVVNIAEDKEGNLWLGTHEGLNKYDPTYLLKPNGQQFTKYTTEDGLCHDRVSHVMIDSKEQIWIGTWGGVCLFDGTVFTNFPLPNPDINIPTYQETADWVTHILEDQEGNIWFSRSGYAVTKYNPTSGTFTHLTKKDGLSSNCVQSILEDQKGRLWFGSRVSERDHPDPDKRIGEAGLDLYDASQDSFNSKKMIQFSEAKGLMQNDVYTLYEDESGDLWFSAVGYGIYRYDGKSFTLFDQTNRSDLTARMGIQAILEDSEGTFWFGFSGGLFRLNDQTFEHITQEALGFQ